MNALRAFSNFVDTLTTRIGAVLSVLVWFIAAVIVIVVVLRYVFHISMTWLQDTYIAIHAVVFMLGCSVAMLQDAHVRVDIFQGRWPPRKRAVVEIVGASLFTLPWLIALGWLSTPFVLTSWKILEGSFQPNGLPGVYLLKSVLIIFCVLMTLQCLSIVARAILVLLGDEQASRTAPFAGAETESAGRCEQGSEECSP